MKCGGRWVFLKAKPFNNLCLYFPPQVRITCWRSTSWSVRFMTLTSLISCSMASWRKLIFSFRSALFLWLDPTQLRQICFPACFLNVSPFMFCFFYLLGAWRSNWLRRRVEPLCEQAVQSGWCRCGALCQTDGWTGCVWPSQSSQSSVQQVRKLLTQSVVGTVLLTCFLSSALALNL